MKKATIIFWISTLIIVIFEGVIPLFTYQTELAKDGIAHLGYPAYFGGLITLFKVLGAIGLILPQVRGRLKEWVYAGFAFDFVFASLSYLIVDGFGITALFPLIFVVILTLSYRNYHKIQRLKTASQM